MNIFETILSPFIYFIEQVFLLGYTISGNYGLSIIFLSLIVSLLLLPVFIMIERAKKRDDVVKAKMKPLLDEIKRCYKGQERYYYIKTINRQHNYSSIRALVPILSLLLQIPFFIAAYQFLENFEPMAGVSFLFIKNLSEPDALLGVINILPIIMTVVNLLTAYYYTRNGNVAERKQMIVVAAIFLILLFNLPAGLVLYWTMNNVFSFLRLFVTNPEVFRKGKKQKIEKAVFTSLIKKQLLPHKKVISIIFYVVTGLAVFSQLNWAFNQNFDDIVPRLFMALGAGIIVTFLSAIAILASKKGDSIFAKIKVKPKVFYSLLFLTIYFHLAAIYYFTGENIELSYMALVVLIPTQFIAFLYFLRAKKQVNFSLFLILSFILIFTFITQIFNLIVFISGNPIELSFLNLSIVIANSTLANIISAGIVFVLLTTPYYLKIEKVKLAALEKSNWVLFLFSVFYLVGFVFLWNPLSIYSSFPETFEFPGVNILSNNFGLFIKSLIFSVVIYLIVPKKVKRILLFISLFLVVSSFIYSTIIPINVGSLQVTKFSQQGNLASALLNYFLEGLLLIGIAFGIGLIFKKKVFKFALIAVLLLNIVLISQSLYDVVQSGDFTRKEIILKSEKSIPFSKEKKNVVFFIVDMFHGWSMHDIIKDNPKISNQYEGFVYYPNTLSVGTMTAPSISAMMLGLDYSPDAFNIDSTRTIGEKITEVCEIFQDQISDNGYDFTSTRMVYSKIDKSGFDNYLPSWTDDWSNKLNMESEHEMGYTILWENALFFSAPLFLKPEIYKDGMWMHKKREVREVTTKTKRYYFMQILPKISNPNSENPNFIYIHSMVSHHPWDIVDDEGVFHTDVSPFENNKWTIETFGKWLDWMKKNGVYDNTKIILVSDHGPHWGHYEGDFEIDVPFKNNTKKASEKHRMTMNALLLVKDFNAKGTLKTDWRFMSNSDVNAIAFDKNDPTKWKTPYHRTLQTWDPRWSYNFAKEKKFNISTSYFVEDDYFDFSKWKKR